MELTSLGLEYDLTDEEFFRSLSRAEMGVFMQSRPSENPRSVFIVAQPGAGKTGLKLYKVNRGQDNGTLSSCVEFNPDEIGTYHEHYTEIMRDYPNESFLVLQRFVQPALDDYLHQKAVDLRVNIVQEGTFANTDTYLDIMDFQKNGGQAPIGPIIRGRERAIKTIRGDYDIEIAVLAVDRFESLLSSYEREQYFRESGMQARVVQKKYHDLAYVKMLDTLDEVERRGLADKIIVYKRGRTEDKPPVKIWKTGEDKFSSARDAIVSYRNLSRRRMLSQPEQYKQRVENLLSRAHNLDQIDRLEALLEEFEQELRKYQTRE